MWLTVLFSCLGLVAAAAAIALSLHTWHNAPGRRFWLEHEARLADLEHDQEQLHARLHTRARQVNMAKATEVREEKRGGDAALLAEATEALRAVSKSPPARSALGTDEASLVEWRRRAGLH